MSEQPRAVSIALAGFGRVGRTFADTVSGSGAALLDRYGLDVRVRAIRTSASETVSSAPGRDDPAAWRPAGSFSDFLARSGATTLVQCIPSDTARASEAFDQVATAFSMGLDVVTATKSHLVTRWSELAELAERERRRIRISAAAGAALPAVDLARRGIRGFGCRRFRASLNGTSNFVLEEVVAGRSLADAIGQAQALGIAESDPSYDLSGRDSASKLVLIANLLWGTAWSLSNVDVAGIEADVETRARDAALRGWRLRSIGEAHETGAMSVAVREVDPSDAFHGLAGPEKLVEFDCPSAGEVRVSGGKSSPQGAALALLKDVVNLATGDEGLGFD